VSVSRNNKAVADGVRAYDEAAAALERRMPVSAQELDEHHRLHQARPKSAVPRAPMRQARSLEPGNGSGVARQWLLWGGHGHAWRQGVAIASLDGHCLPQHP
jgi:hypothetical protein